MYHLNRKVEFYRRYQHLNFVDKKIEAQGGDVTTYIAYTQVTEQTLEFICLKDHK